MGVSGVISIFPPILVLVVVVIVVCSGCSGGSGVSVGGDSDEE